MMADTRLTRTAVLCLAIAATATAVCISVLAGWQRGGWLSERLLWIAIGAVLVVTAHTLPALCRSAPLAVRCVGAVLWGGCVFATCYGHAVFFLSAQMHAGEARAAAVAIPDTTQVTATGRSLSVVAVDRANVTTALAAANAQRCAGGCASLKLSRVKLAGRLDALNVEADEAKRREAADDRQAAQQDRVTARRDDLRVDPVTSRVAALLGVPAAQVDLLSGLAFAAVLEGVACLLWILALQPGFATATDATVASTEPQVTTRHGVVAAPDSDPVTAGIEPEDDATSLAREIAAGRVRATVRDIRQFLGCSQAKAAELRRQLTQNEVSNGQTTAEQPC
ncbi:hypothetical protein P0D88_16805 [Paraburkholderia sp. RL18-103-BIB-C]|uniref:hypothetical protein n=1 Tax=Paraburkholderia sp. RL18-103-BIB-C TaxID=3031637 RepID=UPI0038B6CEFA